MQKGILETLQAEGRPVAASVILARLTPLPPTASQRASLSKSLRRLEDRGAVVSYYPEVQRPGRGLLYGLSEQRRSPQP